MVDFQEICRTSLKCSCSSASIRDLNFDLFDPRHSEEFSPDQIDFAHLRSHESCSTVRRMYDSHLLDIWLYLVPFERMMIIYSWALIGEPSQCPCTGNGSGGGGSSGSPGAQRFEQ